MDSINSVLPLSFAVSAVLQRGAVNNLFRPWRFIASRADFHLAWRLCPVLVPRIAWHFTHLELPFHRPNEMSGWLRCHGLKWQIYFEHSFNLYTDWSRVGARCGENLWRTDVRNRKCCEDWKINHPKSNLWPAILIHLKSWSLLLIVWLVVKGTSPVLF